MTKRIARLLHSTIQKYRLLEANEKVLVAVSGGADSFCLLRILQEYNQKRRQGWQLFAVHVDPGFPGWQTRRIERALQRLGVDYEVARTDVPERQTHYAENICYVCSRERRKRLFEIARQRGIRKIALAHHLEDVNETYLLNLIFNSSAATFVPRQPFFGGALELIRPLYRFDRQMIERYLASQHLRAVRNRCPGERPGRREQIRRFLNRLYRQYPRIRTNIFFGISNIKAQYLP